jgi:Putative Ig domain
MYAPPPARARGDADEIRARCDVPRRLRDRGSIGRVGVRLLAAFAAALVAAFTGTASAGTSAARLAHVTLIGDSVATAVEETSSAASIVRQGVDLDLETAPCRRVDDAGCPGPGGVVPPSVVQLTKQLGSKLGPYVVVAVGYNDFEDHYAQNIENALAAFREAGVKHVWWLTLRAAHHPYIPMNADIEASAQNHPEMTVIEWNLYSRSHPEWFQADGVHLLEEGADQMASLIHRALLTAGVALPPVRVATASLPVAHHGKKYVVRLRASKGLAPYTWSLLERAPAGIHLEASGVVEGTARARPGRYAFDVKVRDAAGSYSMRRLTLRIAP